MEGKKTMHSSSEMNGEGDPLPNGHIDDDDDDDDDDKQQRIRELEAQVRALQATVSKLLSRDDCAHAATAQASSTTTATTIPDPKSPFNVGSDGRRRRRRRSRHDDDDDGDDVPLTAPEIERYSRQLILSQGFGVKGQQRLLSSSVLVIGAGGIGSTLLLYLAAAGVGHVGVCDFDVVEISNLHRQVIHDSHRVGVSKAVSAQQTLQALNPTIDYTIHECQVDCDNALSLVRAYDCVVDCSDNPKTRYLVNDACVLDNKPLISGSAVGLEGQITVYNYKGGPCYRCLYPRPSATGGCRACADAGVFGPVPGLIGVLQATETIKVLTETGAVLNDRLLMYDSMQATFLSIKKPPKRANCPVCGKEPSIQSMTDSRDSLVTATGPQQPQAVVTEPLAKDLSVTCQEYSQIRQSGTPHILLDVRVTEQYELCHLRGALHVPLEQLTGNLDRMEKVSGGELPIYCICRRGVASADATRVLHEAKVSRAGIHSVFNITGGLDAWRETVDSSFPKY